VLVHVDGAPDAILQEDSSGDGHWTTVCAGACDALLPIGPTYRIDGDGMRRSGSFQLQPPSGNRVTLDVAPGSSARFAWGIALLPIGAATIAGGFFAWFAAALGSAGGSEAVGEPGPPNYTPGTVLIVVGAVAMVGGVILLIHDWGTDVRQTNVEPPKPLPPLPDPPSPDRPPPDLFTGGWRERSPEERALPAAMVAPLWGGRF
jgi:hypothetical protein